MCKRPVYMTDTLYPSCMPRCSTVYHVQFIRTSCVCDHARREESVSLHRGSAARRIPLPDLLVVLVVGLEHRPPEPDRSFCSSRMDNASSFSANVSVVRCAHCCKDALCNSRKATIDSSSHSFVQFAVAVCMNPTVPVLMGSIVSTESLFSVINH